MEESEHVYSFHFEVAEEGVVPAAVAVDVRLEGFESLLSCDYRKHQVGNGKNDSANRLVIGIWYSARHSLMNLYRRIIHKLIILLISHGSEKYLDVICRIHIGYQRVQFFWLGWKKVTFLRWFWWKGRRQCFIDNRWCSRWIPIETYYLQNNQSQLRGTTSGEGGT